MAVFVAFQSDAYADHQVSAAVIIYFSGIGGKVEGPCFSPYNSTTRVADITCLGISTLRASFLTWNRKTEETFHNFITWKDKRCEKLCEQWNSSFITKLLRFGAGTLYFFTRIKLFQIMSSIKFTSAMVLTRLYWILKHDEKIRHEVFKEGTLFGTIDTWLIWKLTGGKVHATDPSNACVTGFFDIFKQSSSESFNGIFFVHNIIYG
ncbi:putative glycerol kinase 5 [Trichonephila clavipes]|uniref:Putative glycerol kinase 5 n=1 Tax=Trichonephila clavipes TaxID=2585209 RepID=A0A8X6VB04_TRICX|nr:putative glycerol kinase 5 [Trichonephila clavipes]